jgi:hypothetical protein
LGYILAYCAEDNLLLSYAINGHLLACKVVPEQLYALTLSEDEAVIISGGSSCLVSFRWIATLDLASDGLRTGLEAVIDGSVKDASTDNRVSPFNSAIRSIYLTKQERHLIVGLESGEMRILAQDSDYLRHRLQRKLISIGIL